MSETRWRDIDTAPKNGTPILLYVPKGVHSNDAVGFLSFADLKVLIGWWDASGALNGSNWECCFTEEGSADSFGRYSTFYIGVKPSHWMPLPDGPALQEPPRAP